MIPEIRESDEGRYLDLSKLEEDKIYLLENTVAKWLAMRKGNTLYMFNISHGLNLADQSNHIVNLSSVLVTRYREVKNMIIEV